MAEDRPDREIVALTQSAVESEEQEAEEDSLPPDFLEAVPPERRRNVTQAFTSLTSIAGPALNPMFRRITSDHLTQMITNSESQSNRDAEAGKANRRYQFAYFMLALAALLFLLIFFTMRQQYDLLTAVVTGAMGFGGGFGIGRLTGGR